MGISLPHCYTVYRNGTVPIADSRHGGGVNEVAGVGIKARTYVCLYIYIYTCLCRCRRRCVQLEKPQAEERTREEGGKEEGRGNAERG